MNKKSKSKSFSIPKSFLLFGFLSFLFWILINLSKEYKTAISFPVEYINLPQNKLLQDVPVSEITIHIKGSGFKLFSAKFIKKTILLDVNSLSLKKNTKYFFLLNRQRPKIQKQLKNGLEIDYFIQDSIFLNLGYLATKKIPVKGNFDVNYKKGYGLVSKISITPDSILISGPEAIIDTLSSIYTEKQLFKDVSADILKEIFIKIPENIKLKTTKVLVSGKVDKFTEGSFELPFLIKNLPDSIKVNTFPKTVKVVFKVGLSSFSKVTETTFRVVCDYGFSKKNNLSYLVPKLVQQSKMIKSVKMTPQKIDFLIQN